MRGCSILGLFTKIPVRRMRGGQRENLIIISSLEEMFGFGTQRVFKEDSTGTKS